MTQYIRDLSGETFVKDKSWRVVSQRRQGEHSDYDEDLTYVKERGKEEGWGRKHLRIQHSSKKTLTRIVGSLYVTSRRNRLTWIPPPCLAISRRAHKQCSVTCMLSHFSCVQLFATLWSILCQAPLSIRFSRWEYCSGPPPGIFPTQGWNQRLLQASCISGWFFYPLNHLGNLWLSN